MIVTTTSIENTYVYIASKDAYNKPCIIQVRTAEHKELVNRMIQKKRVFTTYAEARREANRLSKSILRGIS